MDIIYTDNAPYPGTDAAQAVRFNGLLFVGAQLPINPDTQTVTDLTFEGQITRIMRNLYAVLHEAGLQFSDTLHLTVYLTQMDYLQVFERVYHAFFTGAAPARVIVQVEKLPLNVMASVSLIAQAEPLQS